LVTTTLNLSNLANHGHLVSGHLGVSEEDANTTDAEGNALAGSAAHNMYVNAPPEVDLAENSVGGTSGLTGNNQAFNNRQPYLGLNFIISTSGQYPSRN
jgi:microcystin-dependent protein